MEFDRQKRYALTGAAATHDAPVPGKQTLTQSMVQMHPAAAASSAPSEPATARPLPVPSGPRPTLQMLFGRRDRAQDPEQVHAAAARGTATAATQLPHLEQIQRSFGKHDVSGVQAHVGTEAAASTQQMGAAAYATGNHVVLGAGTDLHTVAHEAAHVLQQRGGVQLKGGLGEVGDAYEQHADAVADLVVQGKSAEVLLDRHAGTGPAIASAGSGIQRIVDDPDVIGPYEIARTAGIDVDDTVKAALLEGGNLAVLKPIVNRQPGNFRRVYLYIAHDVTTAAQRVANLVQYRALVDDTAVAIPDPRQPTADDTAFLGRIHVAVTAHGQPFKSYLVDMKNRLDRLRAIDALDPTAFDVIAALVHSGAKSELKSEGALPSLIDAYGVCPPGAGPTRWDWGSGNKGSAAVNKEAHIDKHVLYIGGDPAADMEAWKWKEAIGYDLGTADLTGLGIDPGLFNEIEQCLGGPTGQLDNQNKYKEFFITKRFQDLDAIKQKLRGTWGQQYLALASDLTQGMARYVTSRDFKWHRVHGQVNQSGNDVFIIGKVVAGAVAISSAYIPYQDEHTALLPFVAWQV